MEDQKHPTANGTLIVNKSLKKKPAIPVPETFNSLPAGTTKWLSNEARISSDQKGQKSSKRGATNDASGLFPERLTPDSVGDSSSSGNEYRALRRKYLLLEEESFGLGREAETVENDIKALEQEKLSLLDELVVLEGLVDPSDIQPPVQRLQ